MNVPIRYSLRGPQKTTKNHAQYIQSPGWDRNHYTKKRYQPLTSDIRSLSYQRRNSPGQQIFGAMEVTARKAIHSSRHLGDRCEWSTSVSGRFTPGTYWIGGWPAPQPVLTLWIKVSCAFRKFWSENFEWGSWKIFDKSTCLIFTICATCLAQLICLFLTTLKMSGDELKFWSSSLYIFFQTSDLILSLSTKVHPPPPTTL